MGQVSASIHLRASVAEVWDYFVDSRCWPAWVDGFGALESTQGYPEVGGTVRWRSRASGRGAVEERVVEHRPRRLQRMAYSDPLSEGELATTFAIEPGPRAEPGTRVTQELEYRMKRRGPITWLADRFFVRSQLRRSLERQLAGLRAEVEGRGGLARP